MIRSTSFKYSACQGFALILVLGIVVLLAGLVVGFLMRTTTERSAASEYHASIHARQLADTAVSIVQGQVNQATSQGSNVAWASQPGMVRTFDNGGNLLKAYKLYSAQNMVSGSVGIDAGKSEDEPPANWADNPCIWVDLNAPVNANGVENYPILDPSATASGYVIQSPGNTTSAPMPVQWLYVLQDGSLVAPSGSGNTARVVGETASNPIVGRVGFWTDDDTCKVNVNTAGEGTYWDTPRGVSTFERDNLANYQPAQKEFQRYPGHPASVCLSAVFPSLSEQQILGIAPRIEWGGSEAATVIATGTVSLDSDRLYDSIDELIFKPDRTANPVTRDMISHARFFLTAHSRAPETNLFNMPRIACWPIYSGLAADRVTPFDELIAFCASTGTGSSLVPYYFQRSDPTSSTNDISISRNTQLYGYLQYLTSNAIPGFGGKFDTKYSASDRDQILTEIFDYIRCLNLSDDLLPSAKQYTPSGTGHGWVMPTKYNTTNTSTMGFGRNYTISELAIGFICNAATDDPATTGTDESLGSNNPATNKVLGGTALSGSQKMIQAIMVPEFFSAMQGWVSVNPKLILKMEGLSALTVTTGGVTANLFPNLDDDFASYKSSTGWWGVQFSGGRPNWRWFGCGKGSPARGNLPADSGTLYPFIGNPVRIAAPANGGTMQFSGGTVTLKLYAGSTSSDMTEANRIQTIQVVMPASTFPVPNLVSSSNVTSIVNSKENWWSFNVAGEIPATSGSSAGRLAGIANNTNSTGIFFRKDFDVVRSMVPMYGDFRLVEACDSGTNLFMKHAYYDDTTQRIACSMSGEDASDQFPGHDTRGAYISSISYPSNITPDISVNAPVTPEATGDFDNGVSVIPDGPYVNKPDEGNTLRSISSIPYFDLAWQVAASGTTFFSPNRQMPSPGMFGSLPTGVKSGTPWQTLLFRPQSDHPGTAAPKDHLLMDLFWMPVVEPYAISDRFSTAGKINLNYQILPFTYITRSTGLRALLKGEMLGAIPNTEVNNYKVNVHSTYTATATPFRLSIDADATLAQFQDNCFLQGNIFKSASEICDVPMIPEGESASTMANFWKQHALTGDNLRERIYTTLYPRLTTKSNTFTVHFCAQELHKAPGSTPGTWTENRDSITAEYRGSTTIERFINANNPSIPDYTLNPGEVQTLDNFYKWRVIENRQFAP